MPPSIVSLMCDCLVTNPKSRPTFDEIDSRLKRLSVENIEPADNQYSSAKDREAKKNEELLHKVFPKHIAEALREGRKVEPEHYDCVTIFFSDIVGFTDISGASTPLKIADMLDRLYLAFDWLSDEHGVFKIETIGDAWVGVTNLVEDQADHAERVALFAIDAIEAASKTLIDLEHPEKGCIHIRVGFHSGPVLSNVVGSRNPKFSIFGDTVNTASRMESNSSSGKILCSETSAELMKQTGTDLHVNLRGDIDVKGKGQMKTFWVSAPRRLSMT
jgi:class 3 adenylate cyclase